MAKQLWIGFGTGKNFRYISIHGLCLALGPLILKVFPLFHSFIGCDTVSAFSGKGKNSAWDTWSVYEELSEAFLQVIENPNEVEILKVLKVIERYVVLLYDRSSTANMVNEFRKQLFMQKTRTIDNISPTRDALLH